MAYAAPTLFAPAFTFADEPLEVRRVVGWTTSYVRGLGLTVALVLAVIAAQFIRIGAGARQLQSVSMVRYSVVSVALIMIWLIALSMLRIRSTKIVGSGAEGCHRITRACLLSGRRLWHHSFIGFASRRVNE